jgi:peroxiredoxin Q/BCP
MPPKSVSIDSKVPDFSLPSTGGEPWTVASAKGRNLVVYFYPKDNTSGCTREACSFQDNLKAIEKKGAVVVGVSPDGTDSHRKFAEKYELTFPLVSDEKKEIVKKYGVWKEKSLYGKKYMGVERTTFIIDGKGTVSHIFPKVKVDGHTEEILAAL